MISMGLGGDSLRQYHLKLLAFFEFHESDHRPGTGASRANRKPFLPSGSAENASGPSFLRNAPHPGADPRSAGAPPAIPGPWVGHSRSFGKLSPSFWKPRPHNRAHPRWSSGVVLPPSPLGG